MPKRPHFLSMQGSLATPPNRRSIAVDRSEPPQYPPRETSPWATQSIHHAPSTSAFQPPFLPPFHPAHWIHHSLGAPSPQAAKPRHRSALTTHRPPTIEPLRHPNRLQTTISPPKTNAPTSKTIPKVPAQTEPTHSPISPPGDTVPPNSSPACCRSKTAICVPSTCASKRHRRRSPHRLHTPKYRALETTTIRRRHFA